MNRPLLATLAAVLLASAPSLSRADTVFYANLSGSQEVPPTGSTATGNATLTLNAAETNIHISLSVTGFTNTITASHVHKAMFGQNGSVIRSIGAFTGSIDVDWPNPTATDLADLKSNRFYVNVHSNIFAGGEIRGQVRKYGSLIFGANLNQAQEVPPTGSAGTGYGDVTLDNDLNLHVEMSATGLSGPISTSHIHAGPAGVNGPVVFTIGPFSGTVSADFTVTPTQRDGLLANGFYLNIHTGTFPGGEIRGQIGNVSPAEVPDQISQMGSTDVTAFPNPAYGSAVLRYRTDLAGAAQLDVYNVAGQRVRTLLSGTLPVGQDQVTWDGRDDAGVFVPSGVYYYALQAGSQRDSGRLTLLR